MTHLFKLHLSYGELATVILLLGFVLSQIIEIPEESTKLAYVLIMQLFTASSVLMEQVRALFSDFYQGRSSHITVRFTYEANL